MHPDTHAILAKYLQVARADLTAILAAGEADPDTADRMLAICDTLQIVEDTLQMPDEAYADSQAAALEELQAHGDDRPHFLTVDKQGRPFRTTYNDAGERCCDP